MSSSNLQQWWESTYRHHQAKTTIYDANVLLQQPQQQRQQYDPPLAPFNVSITRTTTTTTTLPIITTSSSSSPSVSATSIIEAAVSAIGHLNSDYETSAGGGSSAFDNYYFINSNIFRNISTTTNNNNNIQNNIMSNDDYIEYDIPSLTVLFMAISYGLVVFGGILGNATLVLTLCSASSVRLRNPLLLAVCIADLLVTGISAPITLLNLAMNHSSRSLPLAFCKILHYIQIMPVTASTISFFLLSLDRYATVKHPRLAQLRQRRYLHASLALMSWVASAAICAPFLFAYKIIGKTGVVNNNNNNNFSLANTSVNNNVTNNNHMRTNYNNNINNDNSIDGMSCTLAVGDYNSFFSYFVFFHTFAVFVLPGLGVLLNHYGVRQKLCALSLTARAAHGELPLPMPILRRQTHMVIVTGITKVQKAAAGCTTQTEDDETSNEENCGIQMQNMNPIEENVLQEEENREQDDIVRELEMPATIQVEHCQTTLKTSNPISPRAMREIRAHSQRQRINGAVRSCRGPATPGIPLPQISTLHSRRRLANMLIASALIFIACWSPHVFCIFYTYFGKKNYCTTTSTYFNLLLGYMYSAISPVIYWILNHNTLRQSPCAPMIGMRSMQNFLRSRFRSHAVPPPAPSSTNEAALGPFNPKFIKLTPKQYRAQASSHYLY